MPELQARLRGVDPDAVVEIAAAVGYPFGVRTLHRSVCSSDAMTKLR